MQEISTLFTAIGDFFTKADWFTMVKSPFWILLCTVAAGGVYCARFGKNTLLNQGVTGVLYLVLIYMAAIFGYIYLPALRSMFSELPFLIVNEESVTFLDPLSVNPLVLAPVLLRLIILTLSINLCNFFGTGGKTLITWFFSQILTAVFGLVFYAIVMGGLTFILPCFPERYAIIPVVLFVVIGILLLCAKFIFTVLISGGNPYFSAVYKFFTVNKGGVLLTTSALSILLSLVVLLVMQMTGNSTLEFSSFNVSGLWVILLMLLVVFYIFSMFYTDRKKS